MPSIPVGPPGNPNTPTPIGQIPVNPNFLFFAPDDFGREYLSIYNRLPAELQVYTPNIQKLVQSGVTFTRAYSQPLCSPSRAAWLTGRGGWQTGVGGLAEGENQPLLSTEVCLPAALKTVSENLYACAGFIKWHLSDWTTRGGAYEHPIRCGFDYFEGHLRNLESGESYNSFEGFTAKPSTDGTSVQVDRYHVAEWAPKYYAERAGEWIRAQNSPWLVWFAVNLPHIPYNRPPSFAYDTDTYDLPGYAPASINANDTPEYFKAMVQGLDWDFGYLLQQIPQAQLGNTVVILWSDNGTQGESFDTLAKTGIDLTPYLGADYTTRAKRTVYELGVNVPLIVSGPKVTAPGRTSSSLISPADLFRTVIDLSGFDYADLPIDPDRTRISTSFAADLTAGTPSARTYVPVDLFSPNGPNVDCSTPGTRAIVQSQYKLIKKNSTGTGGFPANGAAAVTGIEMYDVAADPKEQTNLLRGQPTNISLTTAENTAYLALQGVYATAFSTL